MSIISETFYTVQCDRCGKILRNEYPEAGWVVRESFANYLAIENEWAKIDRKHYCPDCYEVDEETDECKVKDSI